jgi:hypothetical protein
VQKANRYARGGEIESNLLKARREVDRQGGGVGGCRGCRMVGAGGVRSPSRAMDDFSADYIFYPGGKVVELVNAFEQPSAGNRARRGHRGRGVSRFREEDPVYLEASEVGGWSIGM